LVNLNYRGVSGLITTRVVSGDKFRVVVVSTLVRFVRSVNIIFISMDHWL
jgi:hypothetical protein